MGWENVFHCEWNKFGQKVLSYYWPKAISYNDIKETDFTIHRGEIDILTGGFPCQPYSGAGKRLGKEDDRHLWPEMLRAIREIQPGYIVGENVRGLTNWNGGVVFDEVQAEMEAQGYEVLPFLLPACAVNAPHRRDRIWFVAYDKSEGLHERQEINRREKCEQKGRGVWNNSSTDGESRDVANTKLARLQGKNRASMEESVKPSEQVAPSPDSNIRREGRMHKAECKATERHAGSCDALSYRGQTWDNFPTQSPLCSGDDGFPTELDGITFPKWRKQSIQGGGNAIVPQLAYQIFKAIEDNYYV